MTFVALPDTHLAIVPDDIVLLKKGSAATSLVNAALLRKPSFHQTLELVVQYYEEFALRRPAVREEPQLGLLPQVLPQATGLGDLEGEAQPAGAVPLVPVVPFVLVGATKHEGGDRSASVALSMLDEARHADSVADPVEIAECEDFVAQVMRGILRDGYGYSS